METEQKRAFIIQILYYLIWAAAFILVIKYGFSKLAPFVLAFIIASILRKPTCSLSKTLKLPQKPVALLLVLVFYSTIGLLITFLSIQAFWAINSLFQLLPGFYTQKIEPAFLELFVNLEIFLYQTDDSLLSLVQGFDDQFLQWLGDFITGLSGWAVATASNIATSIPGLFLKVVLMIIATFFIAADYEILTNFCMRQLNERSKALFLQIKNYLVGTLLVCIRSYAIIILLTFIELSLGLSLIGIENATLIAALIAVFDILPVLGTGGIMIPWGIFSLLRGELGLGIALLLLYVVITVIRNIIEPKIVGSQLGLHPVVTLASMFAGVQLGGVIGLFGFPIGLSLLRYLNDNGSIHIFNTNPDK